MAEVDPLVELGETTEALSLLARDESAFTNVLEAFRKRDVQAVRALLDRLNLGPRCRLVCRWLCVWDCARRCRIVCRQVPKDPPSPAELRDLALGMARLGEDEALAQALVEAVDNEDASRFGAIAEDLGVAKLCFLLCRCVCSLRCRRFCRLICSPETATADEPAPHIELMETARAMAALAQDENSFATVLRGAQAEDPAIVRNVLARLDLLQWCHLICRWVCCWRTARICIVVCRQPLVREPTIPQLREYALTLAGLSGPDLPLPIPGVPPGASVLEGLLVAIEREDTNAYAMILERIGLSRFCFLVCRWISAVVCAPFCELVCPPALVCKLTGPTKCVAEVGNEELKTMVVAVHGSAGGGNFDHYVLEWSDDNATWHASDFHYPPIPPGGGTQGNSPVFGGLLAYLDTAALSEGPYFIRMTVFATNGATSQCPTQFRLFKQDVRILQVNGVSTFDSHELDPAARFVETVPALCTRPVGVFEVSFGDCISILGSAVVGGCDDKKIKRYSIDYKAGFETNPATGGWTNVWSIDYSTVWQYREMNMRRDTSVLTSIWVPDCVAWSFVPFPHCIHTEPSARLSPSCWQTKTGTCTISGLVTLRLTVEDTAGTLYYDTQRIWIDNKKPCAMIRIDAVRPCEDILLSDFAKPPDCGVSWPLPISGIAFDELIDELLPATRPNDNFDHYTISVSKQGGSSVHIPIPGPTGTCFHGTSRVGDPGVHCTPCDPAAPDPSASFGTLAEFDLRAIDPDCSAQVTHPLPTNFQTPRGECCVYQFRLFVQDRTYSTAGTHWAEAYWPVKICNDLAP